MQNENTHKKEKSRQKVIERWLANTALRVKYSSSEFLSAGSTFIQKRTMIDLGQMKNCLNCSYFTLMLNTVKQGCTGKLLATAEGEIKPFMRLRTTPLASLFKVPTLFDCLPLPEYTCNLLFLSCRGNVSFSYYSFLCSFLQSLCFFKPPPASFLSHLSISLSLFLLSPDPIPFSLSLLQ